jgi:hypothetical protein
MQEKQEEKRKQDLFDFVKEHIKEVSPNDLVVILDQYRGTAVIKYPVKPIEESRFEYTLLWADFPYRNLVPVYDRDYKVIEWIEGEDTIPGPALQRFLDSGEKTYIPEYHQRSSEEGTALLHGKYHFGSSVNC